MVMVSGLDNIEVTNLPSLLQEPLDKVSPNKAGATRNDDLSDFYLQSANIVRDSLYLMGTCFR